MDLVITKFPSRRQPRGKVCQLTWEQLKTELRNPIYTEESLEEYALMSNEERTDAKDVGGFVGGELVGGRRSKAALRSRCVVTIDADYAKLEDPESFSELYPYVFCCHTTHTSTDDKPRLRWVFPLSRPVEAPEYRVLAGIVGAWIGLDTLDESTDQPERLMFWPSASWDADFHFWEGGDEVLDVEALLNSSEAQELQTLLPAEEEEPVSLGELLVQEGHRNKTLFSVASNFRGLGMDAAGIRAMLAEYNERYCSPPMEPWELDTIVNSVCSHYRPGEAIAPSLRDAWDDFNDLGEWKAEAPKKIERLRAESWSSLDGRYIAPANFVVPGLISEGITFLASPPKFGKSWMCLDLAFSVASGTDFLGIQTNRTGTIYLALEDSDARLQERGRKVLGNRPKPENMYLIKEAPLLAENLLGQLKALMDSVETPVGLIIIDTLQKIRGVAGKTEGVYGYDYREAGLLHQFAIENHLALVLVHHLNKGGDDGDIFSRLNGSTGLTGAADNMLVLSRAKRMDNVTILSATGRDIEQRELAIQMNWGVYRWESLGELADVEAQQDALDYTRDPVVMTVKYRMAELEDLSDEDVDTIIWQATSAELLAEVERMYGPQPDIASATSLGRKVKALSDMLASKDGIEYEYRRTNSKRLHTFTREKV